MSVLKNSKFIYLDFTAEKQEMKKVYDTANFYHFVHTMALLAVPLSRRPVLVCTESLNTNCCFCAYHYWLKKMR